MTETRPASICILRLSALGDVAHVVPLVHTLQAHWPQTRITWLIGKFEQRLVLDMPGVEFVVFDKSRGWRAYLDIRRQLRGRSFDVLLHMQVALRANLLSMLIRAPIRVGYDSARSKDLHGLFVNRRIAAQRGQHVVDGFFSFLQRVGLDSRKMIWDLPRPAEAETFAHEHVDPARRTLIISPCSSHILRNWSAEGYAQVADHAIEQYDMQVVLCGGPSDTERDMGERIVASMRNSVLNLIGKDTIKGLLALLSRADVLITPDSGPAHMATCAGTPVIGLYAATNVNRSGPYSSRELCVDRYPQAARQFMNKTVDELAWGTKIERPGVMSLITAADVIEKLDALQARQSNRSADNEPD